jgi:hypothetical protein
MVQACNHFKIWLVSGDLKAGVGNFPYLSAYRFDQARMAMTSIENANAPYEI